MSFDKHAGVDSFSIKYKEKNKKNQENKENKGSQEWESKI
jgi:hypothetical protein